MMSRCLILVMLLVSMASCTAWPTETPDLVATEVAVQRAVGATLTAEAPTATEAPVATATAAAAADLAPTAAHTPTARATVTARATATLEPTATPTHSPTPSEGEAAPALPTAGGPYAVVGVAAGDVLNVRTGPGVTEPVSGTIPANGLGVSITGAGLEADGAPWVPVQYGDLSGWASSDYLARQVGWADRAVVARATEIIIALRDRKLDELARVVHPEQGVRFSPYAYVEETEDLVFQAAEVPGLLDSATVYRWGAFDGTGEPIELTFEEYYERFVYDADFARPEVLGLGETVGAGNSINNLDEVYPGAVTVEYHFTGFDPQYGGLDWRSLRLVLVEEDGVWYLVGIVHDEWTI
jgi:hypothetical protein